jgi:hypothetical protein
VCVMLSVFCHAIVCPTFIVVGLGAKD